MPHHFQAAPLVGQRTVSRNQEGAALNALDLFAVHDFVLDHAKHVTHFFFGVCNQLERQFKLGLELVVRLHVVTRHTKNRSASFDEALVVIPELHRFCCATRGIVFGVKIQNDDFTNMGCVGHLNAAGGIRFKFGKEFIDDDCHAGITLTKVMMQRQFCKLNVQGDDLDRCAAGMVQRAQP